MKLLFLMCSLICAKAYSITTVDKQVFAKSASWTWAYSETDEQTGEEKAPYLFETYKVSERKNDLVTIEMFSHEKIDRPGEAHHKFIANVSTCLDLGKKSKKFPRWKIAFYTKSLTGKWELLSKSHKGLAFTEKFNCFSNELGVNRDSFTTVNGDVLPIFQWQEPFKIRSWYVATPGPLEGIAVLRQSRNYQMKLVGFTC